MFTGYNYTRKAWEIIGYALHGEPYCVDCGENGDASAHGFPIFASDNYRGVCFSCREVLR